MGKEARLNPVAQANAVPQKQIGYLKLSDGIGLLGAGLKPVIDEKGLLKFAVMASVARVSDLVPINRVVEIELAIVTSISLEELTVKAREKLEEGEKPAVTV